MRTMLMIGTVAAAAMVFGTADTAKAQGCGYGGYGGYNSGYTARIYSGYPGGYYSPGLSRGYYSNPGYGYYSSGYYGNSGFRSGGLSISFGRSYYGGGRGYYGGGRRGFSRGGRRGFRR